MKTTVQQGGQANEAERDNNAGMLRRGQEERGHGKLYTEMIRKIFLIDPKDEEDSLPRE